MNLPAGGTLAAMVLISAAASVPSPVPTIGDQPAEVFILSTLYRRHDSVPAYSLQVLHDIITRIDPQVLVLDVTPAELAALQPHASKIEYDRVIFPLVQANEYSVYAAEPDEPLFSDIVQPVAERRQRLERDEPAMLAAWQAYDRATYELLALIWRSASDVNSALTDGVIRGTHAMRGALFGADDQRDSDRWNGYFASVIRRAAAQHPGQRVLVLVGIQNRHWLIDELGTEPSIRLVDVEAWLNSES